MSLHQCVDQALVIAAHGERGGPGKNRSLIEHCRRLRKIADFGLVTCGLISGEPAIETAFEEACQSNCKEVLVFPFFMSAGYFASTILSRRLEPLAGDMAVRMLPPLGQAARLPALLVARATETARTAKLAIPNTRLLVVGHGSGKSLASHDATVRFAGALAGHSPFAETDVAFLEERPLLKDALVASERPTVVAGFLCGSGLHGFEDIPAAIRAGQSEAVYAGPIGAAPEIAEIILEACRWFEVQRFPAGRFWTFPVSA